MSLNTKRSTRFLISRYSLLMSLGILTISLISMPVFAQQANFVASLSGQNLSPKVSTAVTGTAKFNVGPDGNTGIDINEMVKIPRDISGLYLLIRNLVDRFVFRDI